MLTLHNVRRGAKEESTDLPLYAGTTTLNFLTADPSQNQTVSIGAISVDNRHKVSRFCDQYWGGRFWSEILLLAPQEESSSTREPRSRIPPPSYGVFGGPSMLASILPRSCAIGVTLTNGTFALLIFRNS